MDIFTRLWRLMARSAFPFQTGGRILHRPTISEGTVYFVSEDGCLYAVDSESGRERWRYQNEAGVNAPALDQGMVYAWGWDDNLFALRREDGHLVWKISVKGGLNAVPEIGNDYLYFAAADGQLYTIEKSSGDIQSKFRCQETEPYKPSGPKPICVDDTVIFAMNDTKNVSSHVYAVTAEGSQEKWRAKGVGLLEVEPVASHGKVYLPFCQYVYKLYGVFALDVQTGETAWEFGTNREVYSPVCAIGDLGVFGGRCEYVHCVDLCSGNEAWRIPGSVYTPMVPCGDLLFFGDAWGTLHALNTRTQQEVWKHKAADHVHPFALSNGRLYFGCGDETKLFVLRCPRQ